MSYQPHTSEDVERMLTALGLDDVDQLFQPIPSDLRAPADLDLPRPHAEQEVAAELGRLAARNRHMDELTCFLGAGSTTTTCPPPSGTWPAGASSPPPTPPTSRR